MRIKTITASSERSLDKEVSEFIQSVSREVIDIKFHVTGTNPTYCFHAMIMYK